MKTKLATIAAAGMLCASTAYAQAAPSNEDCRKIVVADGFLTRAQAECDIAFYSEDMKHRQDFVTSSLTARNAAPRSPMAWNCSTRTNLKTGIPNCAPGYVYSSRISYGTGQTTTDHLASDQTTKGHRRQFRDRVGGGGLYRAKARASTTACRRDIITKCERD